jgi:hypothetical protein
LVFCLLCRSFPYPLHNHAGICWTPSSIFWTCAWAVCLRRSAEYLENQPYVQRCKPICLNSQ